MKIGIYTDVHYSSAKVTCGNRYNDQSLRKIKQAYAFFEKEKCDLIVCLGDVIDTEPTVEKEMQNLSEIAKVMQGSEIKTVCLMGNHDAFVLSREEFYNILGIPSVDEMKIDGKRLLFLDACYFKTGVHYAPGDSGWDDCFLPDDEKLRARLSDSDEDTYIFIHQNIDTAIRADHRIFNSERVFNIINESGVVKTVFQGHYHPGASAEYNGVKYVTLPAMCECENAFWTFEI